MLDGLAKVGFQTNLGLDGAGLLQLFLRRGGGYYIGQLLASSNYEILSYLTNIDTGASQLIIDGHIKVKNGSSIEKFTEDGVLFADGSHLATDVIIFATG